MESEMTVSMPCQLCRAEYDPQRSWSSKACDRCLYKRIKQEIRHYGDQFNDTTSEQIEERFGKGAMVATIVDMYQEEELDEEGVRKLNNWIDSEQLAAIYL